MKTIVGFFGAIGTAISSAILLAVLDFVFRD